jgi:hypothetical protein
MTGHVYTVKKLDLAARTTDEAIDRRSGPSAGAARRQVLAVGREEGAGR